MSTDTFTQLQAKLAAGGTEAVFETLMQQLQAEKKYHELFDVLLMQSRQRLGLPVILAGSIDDLDEPLRSQVEEAYLAGCRQVGKLLLEEGRLREAWMYLRPVGDKQIVAAALAKIKPDEENVQDLIEIGLHEGVAPALGYELVLKNYGTCNAITTYEGSIAGRPKPDQQACAAALLKHLHAELVANVKADIARQEGREPQETTLAALVADRDWLFGENNYHTDTTHLAATARFARVLEERQLVELAFDLTEYGRRLSKQFQFAGEAPFADVYPAHGLFFAAQLDQNIDEAVRVLCRSGPRDRRARARDWADRSLCGAPGAAPALRRGDRGQRGTVAGGSPGERLCAEPAGAIAPGGQLRAADAHLPRARRPGELHGGYARGRQKAEG